MNSGMSVTEDVEITETTAMNSGMSVTEDVGITETTAMNSGMSVTKDMEITGTTEGTAVQPEMSITQDRETKETTAVHPGISLTENMEITETTAVHHGMSDKTKNPKMARGEKIRSGQCKQSKHEQTEINENGHIKTKQTKQQTQRTEKISTNASKQPPLDSTIGKDNTYSNAFTVHVGLTEESYQQQMRDLDGQDQTRSVREKKEQLKAAWEKIQTQLDKTESEAIANNTSLQRVDQNCRNSFGEVTVTSMKQDSLAISLDLPTLYNLYRLKQTCLSGSFPDSFEPLLITDKMREEADKVGLQLKLKATYDQARFDELELFFINRDGGGLEPVKLYDDFNEATDAEEILDEDTVTDQTSDMIVVTGKVDSGSQTEQGNPWKISNLNLRWKGQL
ncbi:uncharacterized protein [Ptychodera flava]|uniref:uncharacterized protein n=1 Tax=Ptychodera flava TaxID=63121 RepID=UPI00396A91A1